MVVRTYGDEGSKPPVGLPKLPHDYQLVRLIVMQASSPVGDNALLRLMFVRFTGGRMVDSPEPA